MSREPRSFLGSLWAQYANIGTVVLIAHVIQNSAALLHLRVSKAYPNQYFPSVACVFVELFKTVMALAMVYYESFRDSAPMCEWTRLFPWFQRGGWLLFLKLSIPSVLYAIAANLVHYGMARLHVPLFQVLYQFRIIATVFISIFLFTDRHYSRTKWICCFCLFVGIVIANLDSFFAAAAGGGAESDVASPEPARAQNAAPHARAPTVSSHLEYTLASLAVLVSGIATAFAGVYTEKLLKETSTTSASSNNNGSGNSSSSGSNSNNASNSPWVRNVHFGTLGVIYTCTLALKDWSEFAKKGVFYGFDLSIYLLTFNQAFGGLIIALVLVYLDSVTRSFAGSISFILCTVLSALFFDFSVHGSFAFGSLVIVISTYIYSLPEPKPTVVV